MARRNSRTTAAANVTPGPADEAYRLSEMLVQHVVGLCCLRANPKSVDVIVGDMVWDPAAAKKRDVDVTVTIDEGNGVVHAIKAYEVKHETKRIGVDTVEQLAIKLKDMPSVTHRAVVSTSEYTDGARSKAAWHGVDLYVFKRWTKPIAEQFPGAAFKLRPSDEMNVYRPLLSWEQEQVFLHVPSGPPRFDISADGVLLSIDHRPHAVWPTFARFRADSLMASEKHLLVLEAVDRVRVDAQTAIGSAMVEGPLGPAWRHTHTMDVSRDGLYLEFDGGLAQIESVTIDGFLQWKTVRQNPQFWIMENVADGAAFAGAMVALQEDAGSMLCLVVSPGSRAVGVHHVRLEERHRNAIRGLRVGPHCE